MSISSRLAPQAAAKILALLSVRPVVPKQGMVTAQISSRGRASRS